MKAKMWLEAYKMVCLKSSLSLIHICLLQVMARVQLLQSDVTTTAAANPCMSMRL